MSVKDKANQANQRDGQNYTKLHSDFYLRCKAKDQRGLFELVVGEEKRPIYTPIEGYLVGQAMVLSSYDDKTGDSLFSAPYYTNRKIALFLRNGKKVTYLLTGTKVECEDKAFELRFGGKFRTKKVYYVAAFTTKGDPKIFCIETSLPMAIELQNKIHPSSFADYLFKFEPTLFDRTMELSPNAKEALKPLFMPINAHMEMGYTNLVQSTPLTDEFEAKMKEGGIDLEAVLDNFIAWKKEQGIMEDTRHPEVTSQERTSPDPIKPEVFYPKTNEAPDSTVPTWDDDLPF